MGWACIWDPGSDIWIRKNLSINAGVKKAQIQDLQIWKNFSNHFPFYTMSIAFVSEDPC